MRCAKCRRRWAPPGEDLCLRCSRRELDKAVRKAARKTAKFERLARKLSKRKK